MHSVNKHLANGPHCLPKRAAGSPETLSEWVIRAQHAGVNGSEIITRERQGGRERKVKEAQIRKRWGWKEASEFRMLMEKGEVWNSWVDVVITFFYFFFGLMTPNFNTTEINITQHEATFLQLSCNTLDQLLQNEQTHWTRALNLKLQHKPTALISLATFSVWV